MKIEEQIQTLRAALPPHVQLVAVSKYHSVEAIREAYDAGQRIFGESHEQELRVKVPALPRDVEWHFIGHLQTNKVRHIAPYISLIHSVDTPKLLREIDKQGRLCRRRIPCLLQLHVAREETKYGFTPEACRAFLATEEWRAMTGVQLAGVMCMASDTDDEQRIVRDFTVAEEFFHEVKARWFADDEGFRHRSWGMSGDYPLAVRHGATLVRVGSLIFGGRHT
ncbi:MAG: YggS family pyridoxal phosphate-dependent enzyme [Bacteroidaceae bacterium]|nr:YggS family pyridoxal phosphate-dependent enzyme [Bacteroidaceae bacterium]